MDNKDTNLIILKIDYNLKQLEMHIEDYIEELLLAAGYSKSEIAEMDLPEMRMNIGWDWNWINNF